MPRDAAFSEISERKSEGKEHGQQRLQHKLLGNQVRGAVFLNSKPEDSEELQAQFHNKSDTAPAHTQMTQLRNQKPRSPLGVHNCNMRKFPSEIKYCLQTLESFFKQVCI